MVNIYLQSLQQLLILERVGFYILDLISFQITWREINTQVVNFYAFFRDNQGTIIPKSFKVHHDIVWNFFFPNWSLITSIQFYFWISLAYSRKKNVLSFRLFDSLENMLLSYISDFSVYCFCRPRQNPLAYTWLIPRRKNCSVDCSWLASYYIFLDHQRSLIFLRASHASSREYSCPPRVAFPRGRQFSHALEKFSCFIIPKKNKELLAVYTFLKHWIVVFVVISVDVRLSVKLWMSLLYLNLHFFKISVSRKTEHRNLCNFLSLYHPV